MMRLALREFEARRQWLVGKVLMADVGVVKEGGSVESGPIDLSVLTQLLRNARVVCWEFSMHNAAIRGAALFQGKSADAVRLGFSPQLWMFVSDDGTPSVMTLRALPWDAVTVGTLVGQDDSEIHASMLAFRATRDSGVIDLSGPLILSPLTLEPQIGPVSTLGSKSVDEVRDGNLSRVLAKAQFMNEEIVSLERERLPRGERRRLARNGESEPDVLRVALRRKKGERYGPERLVDWKHRWLVSGHWRNQYLPGTGEHRPTYVAPYIKGPDDKPFKGSAATKVYHVTR